LIKVIEAHIWLKEIIKDAKVLIKKIVIYTFIFVVFRLNYEILLEQLF